MKKKITPLIRLKNNSPALWSIPCKLLLITALSFTGLNLLTAQFPTVQLQKILADDAAANDQFGYSVSISGDGSSAIVGAYRDNDDGPLSGSAYVFSYNSSTGMWQQVAKLNATDAAAGDRFGQSVSISGDGSSAIVGAWFDDDAGNASGSAYVFSYNSSNDMWQQVAKLTADDAATGDSFGFSVSISGDGSTAIVGAIGDNLTVGSSYIYRYNSSTMMWAQAAKLTASDAADDDKFGYSVSLSGDGSTAIVGVRGDDDGGAFSGSAYIYTYNSSTMMWTQAAKFTSSDAALFDRFGSSVSISGDGSSAIVGALGDHFGGFSLGSAYIYRYNSSTMMWAQAAKLTADDVALYDSFGSSVSISGDGSSAIVGALGDDDAGNASGSAYVFSYISSTGMWQQVAKLNATDAAGGDRFGQSVSISGDGSSAIVGAWGDDSFSGSAYFFGPPPPPVFDNCPDNCLVLNCEDEGWQYIIQAWLGSVTAKNYAGLPLEVEHNYNPLDQGRCIADGTSVVTWSATDQWGLTSTCSSMIVIADTEPPHFVEEAKDELDICNYGTPAEFDAWVAAHGNAVAYDGCWGDALSWSTIPNNPSINCSGMMGTVSETVTFVARDACGNKASTTATFKALMTGGDILEEDEVQDQVQVEAENNFELYQNQPNPFSNETLISFHLPEAMTASLTIYDVSGKVLEVVKGDYSQGYNEVSVSRSKLNTYGVLFYQLETSESRLTKKMILLE